MKNYYTSLFLWLLCLLLGANTQAQSFLSGEFGAPCGYGAGCGMAGSAGGTYIYTSQPNASGNVFFRFLNGGTEYRPASDGDVIPTNSGTPYTSIFTGAFNAFQVIGTNASYNYAFKINGAFNQIAIFEIQGTVRNISSVAQSSAGVYPGQNLTVTATLSGDFSTGQAAFLRYSADGYATSAVVKMTGSGTSYTATIPASTNTAGNNISYYVFTSGDVASISGANANLYTINLNNNAGSNYNYTVASGWVSNATGNWNDASTWAGNQVPPNGVSVNILNSHSVTLNTDIAVQNLTINAGGMLTTANHEITIGAGGSISNNGSYSSVGETVVFSGNGNINGTVTLGNVELKGGVDFGTATTIQDTLTIQGGGFAINNSPSYSVNSVLYYNTGGSFDRKIEWADATLHHVLIGAGTSINFGNEAPTVKREMAGDLVIAGTLEMNGTTTNLSDTIVVAGSLTILSGGTANMSADNGGDFKIKGNFTNNGTFNCNDRAVYFEGASAQTISGSSPIVIDFMEVRNSGAGITLGAPISIDRELRLYNGIIYSDASNLIILDEDAALLAGATGSDASHIDGEMAKITNTAGANFVFPVGDNGVFRAIEFTANSATTTTFTAKYSKFTPPYDRFSLAPSLNRVSKLEFWTLDRSASGTDATVTLHWDADSDVSDNFAEQTDLRVARWDGSLWQDEGQSAISTGATGSITSNIVSDFSPFTLASVSNLNVLPVKLIRFWGEPFQTDQAKLLWESILEIDNDYFVLEHSVDGVNFNSIAIIDGAGNKITPTQYEFTHTEPIVGINYYRLKDVDFNGNFGFSRIIPVEIALPSELLMVLFPNPSSITTSLKVTLPFKSGLCQIGIYDLLGKEILQKTVSLTDYETLIDLGANYWSAGTYIIHAQVGDTRKQFTFIKTD